jgi:hypothetical protein
VPHRRHGDPDSKISRSVINTIIEIPSLRSRNRCVKWAVCPRPGLSDHWTRLWPADFTPREQPEHRAKPSTECESVHGTGPSATKCSAIPKNRGLKGCDVPSSLVSLDPASPIGAGQSTGRTLKRPSGARQSRARTHRAPKPGVIGLRTSLVDAITESLSVRNRRAANRSPDIAGRHPPHAV